MIDNDDARRNLEAAWKKVADPTIATSALNIQRLEEILRGQVAFKYITVTGVLAKATNPRVHPRSLQAGCDLPGAYDARSLCHGVVVGFEKTKGNLFGLSNEPFVGKPARHPKHDKSNPQLRNKRLATLVHDLLESVHNGTKEDAEKVLVSILRIGKKIAESQIAPSVDVDANYKHVVEFVRRFLETSDGGSRLVAVAGAFTALLNEPYVVKVYNPNASDKYSKTVGDIETFTTEKELVSATECKQRPVSLDDIHHGIKKAKDAGIPEYSFVYSDGLASGQESAIHSAVSAACDELDVTLIDIRAATPFWAAMLNPSRRAQFGEAVVTFLRESMKRADVANAAAELWNSLE